jgi:hypothetical protein
MSIAWRDGFQIFNAGSSVEYLGIESERIPEYMEYFRLKNFKRLYVSSFHGYDRKDVSFLVKYPFIEGIYIYSNDIELKGIHALTDLRFLLLAGDHKGKIDFSFFKNLETAHFSWKHKIKDLVFCRKLKELHLRDYKSNTLVDLPELNELNYLELIQCQIESLEGLSKFSRLKKLEAHYLNKLVTLRGIEEIADTLNELSINNCKKIIDHKLVSHLKQLKQLAFNDCGEIPSISFLRSMPVLDTFRFVNTNIKDGDLSHCEHLLKVRFNYKKHYSHTPKQLEKN